jgi:hypothetical protein
LRQVRFAAIIQLEQGTGLSLVKLWLAGLLGEFEVQMEGEFYDGYVRQSMVIDFERFVVEPFERKAHVYPDERSPFSVVAEVDKAEVLAVLLEEEIRKFEHEEDMAVWIGTITLTFWTHNPNQHSG